MEFWIKPETYYAYIGVMFCLALGFAYRIYWGRYCNAKKTSKSIELKLEELRKVDSTEERVKLLSQWLAGEEKQPYIKECVYPAWQRYETQYNESTKQGNPVLPDVYDYFHEDLFVHHFGKRKLAEFVPNTILAMGIIGTFVGIAAGVGGLDPSGDSTAMKHGIGLLLSGMEVKFISSIAGIAISVLWQLFDKGILHKLLTTSFRTVRESIDATYPVEPESIVFKNMLENQEKHMKDFQTFMSERLIPDLVEGMSKALSKTVGQDLAANLSSSISKSTVDQMQHLSEVLEKTMEWQKLVQQEMVGLVATVQHAAGVQSQMADKTTGLSDVLHGYTDTFTEHQNVLVATVHKLTETTEKNAELNQGTAALLEQMAGERDQFQSNVERLTEQTAMQLDVQQRLKGNLEHIASTAESHQHLAETLKVYSELSSASSEQMGELVVQFRDVTAVLAETTGKNAELNQGTAALLEQMAGEREQFQSNVERLTEQTAVQLDVQQRLNGNLEHIASTAESHQHLAETLKEQADLSSTSSQQMVELVEQFQKVTTILTEVTDGATQLLGETSEERKRLDQLVQEIEQQLTDQLSQMDERMETLSTSWGSMSESMNKSSTQLTKSIHEFSQNMHAGISHTFKQFDEELARAVDHLVRGVDSMKDGLEEMPDTIQLLKQSVAEISKQMNRVAAAQQGG